MYNYRAELLFTDTGSWFYNIETEDFYKDMYDNKEAYDLSDLLVKYNDNTSKKVIGKFKPEHAMDVITEFIGLRSKMYSVQFETLYYSGNEDEKKTAKGVIKSVIKNDLKHETYKNILETSGKLYSKMKVIRSGKHELHTIEMNKVSLSAYDDKRWIKDDGISGYAYGNYRILE